MRSRSHARALLLAALLPAVAHADPDSDPAAAAITDAAAADAAAAAAAHRSFHGSIGGGGSFLLTGDGGDRMRYDLALDVKPRSRFGGLIAWRAFDQTHKGLVTAGLVLEGAASRPRLVLDLHGDVGADLDAKRPLLGGGIRSTLMIIGPLGLVVDGGAFLVIDGINHSSLQLQSNALLVARW